MSPEYAMEGQFSIKSDVFSFGVLILEIVSGRKNTSFYHIDCPVNLIGYAWELWKEGLALELKDPSLKDSFEADQFHRCVHVGLLCVQENATDRPTMSDVIAMLSNENMPRPPPKQPAFFTGRGATGKNQFVSSSTNYSTRKPELNSTVKTISRQHLYGEPIGSFKEISGYIFMTEKIKRMKTIRQQKILLLVNLNRNFRPHKVTLKQRRAGQNIDIRLTDQHTQKGVYKLDFPNTPVTESSKMCRSVINTTYKGFIEITDDSRLRKAIQFLLDVIEGIIEPQEANLCFGDEPPAIRIITRHAFPPREERESEEKDTPDERGKRWLEEKDTPDAIPLKNNV
ncbi:Serine-threonine/tyrosine-protein kinase, catalytic domain [Dillenia turbinata]|uniref:Serine-threonine/tyrosine-protein kinase, catalytic domain n=1 Tax=Dillenia turbinata TaxID=194707 RepID=A0AAN8Z749_9MAGN